MFKITDVQFFHVIFLLLVFIVYANAEYSELKMVHVIFRHGERTPSRKFERFPNDPHINNTYFPNGLGGLTNDGRLTMYNFGTFLRKQYNNFLGDYYYPEIARIRSTYHHRSMMSAQLVSAGLWPPHGIQQWNKDLPWIPVPYTHGRTKLDNLMWPYLCPAYKAEYQRVLQSEEVQKLIEPHQEFFAYLRKHTGANVTTPKDVFFIHHTLVAEKNSNLPLDSWTEGYFPDGEMYDVTLLEYKISSWGNVLARLYGGPLLADVLKDYQKFVESTSSSQLNNPKIVLYSGHDSNVASILQTLGLWTPHIPDFGSAVIFELYSNNVTNEFGIQILYHSNKTEETISLTLPGCTQICPIDKFSSLLSNVIPDDIDEACGMSGKSGDSRSSSVSLKTTLYLALELWILIAMT